MVLYWKNMYIVKKLKVSRGTCWDKQMPDCRKLKDWWLKAKVWSFLYDIGCLDSVVAVELPKHVGKRLESTLKPINSLKDFRAQKKEFLLGFDRSNSISFLNYWPYAHSKTICYHIINHTFVLTKVLPKPYRYVSNN